MADITAIELREIADLIEAYNTLRVTAERAGLLVQDKFLIEFKKLETKIQTQLKNTVADKTK